MPKQEGKSIKYEIVAKAFGAILILLFTGWMGWISLAVIEVDNQDQLDRAQWEAIHELRAYHMHTVRPEGHEH